MGPYQRIMLLRGIKPSKAQQPLKEIKRLGPWLENHQAKFNQVETLLKVLRIRTTRHQRSRIVKEIKKRKWEKIPHLNSLTFISLVKVALRSSKVKALKTTLRMVSMIQKRLSIKKIKRVDRIILKQEHQINMKTFNRREVPNNPLLINNNKF
jgi:hypothetical protein|tara:strand:+ start:110 stop:568 length:459 start_codon:yes stop_codon:yes gene_type:complete